jgi:hypothetical protein
MAGSVFSDVMAGFISKLTAETQPLTTPPFHAMFHDVSKSFYHLFIPEKLLRNNEITLVFDIQHPSYQQHPTTSDLKASTANWIFSSLVRREMSTCRTAEGFSKGGFQNLPKMVAFV